MKFIVILVAVFLTTATQAQIHVRVNIGVPPLWGPVGYTEAQYYYLPDVESYYDINSSMFIYYSGGIWVHSYYLPARYRNYDLYGGYKVVMSGYHGNTPYSNFNKYRRRYGKGYRGQAQRNIGERPGRGNTRVNAGGNIRGNTRVNNRTNNRANTRGNTRGNVAHSNKMQGHSNGRNGRRGK